MRIIAGTAGRTRIRVPEGLVRPSTDFVRQAMFSILGEAVVGARALDLFAGSGAIGLEALSRGAATCVFVDHSPRCTTVITDNLAAAGLAGGRAVRAEVAAFLARERPACCDLAFADPPYARDGDGCDLLAELLSGADLRRVLVPDGWFVAEAPAGREPPRAGGWRLHERRRYGGSAILFFAPAGEP